MVTCVLAGASGACGDDADPVVRVSAEGAAWAAVRVGDAWTRHDEVPFSFPVPVGERYEIVTVCRADVGRGWSLLARATEPYDLDLPCWTAEPPPPAQVFPVGLDPTGPLDWAAMGGTWLYTDGEGVKDLAAGTHDLLALIDGRAGSAGRVELHRDVVVDRPLRLPVDVAARGVALVPAAVTVGGQPISDTQATTYTAGGAWFSAFWPAEVLPPSMASPTDEVWLEVRDGPAWAQLEYQGPLDLVLPAEHTTASFRWAPLPVAELETEGTWDWIRLSVDDDFVRSWTVWLAPDVAAEDGQVAITAPPLPDWNPAWLPDPAADHWWSVRWMRERPDGSEGLQVGAYVHAQGAAPGAARGGDRRGDRRGDRGGAQGARCSSSAPRTRSASVTRSNGLRMNAAAGRSWCSSMSSL